MKQLYGKLTYGLDLHGSPQRRAYCQALQARELEGQGNGHGCEGGSAEPLRPKVGPIFTLQPFLAVMKIAK